MDYLKLVGVLKIGEEKISQIQMKCRGIADTLVVPIMKESGLEIN